MKRAAQPLPRIRIATRSILIAACISFAVGLLAAAVARAEDAPRVAGDAHGVVADVAVAVAVADAAPGAAIHLLAALAKIEARAEAPPTLSALQSTTPRVSRDDDAAKLLVAPPLQIGSRRMRVTATSNAIRIAVLF